MCGDYWRSLLALRSQVFFLWTYMQVFKVHINFNQNCYDHGQNGSIIRFCFKSSISREPITFLFWILNEDSSLSQTKLGFRQHLRTKINSHRPTYPTVTHGMQIPVVKSNLEQYLVKLKLLHCNVLDSTRTHRNCRQHTNEESGPLTNQWIIK